MLKHVTTKKEHSKRQNGASEIDSFTQEEDQRRVRRIFRTAIIASLLVHLCIFLSYISLKMLYLPLFPRNIEAREFLEKEQRLEFEFVETPEDAVPLEKKVPSRYVSDKSAQAQDLAPDRPLPLGESYADGQYDLNIYEPGSVKKNPLPASAQVSPKANNEPVEKNKSASSDESDNLYRRDNQENENFEEFWKSEFRSRYREQLKQEVRGQANREQKMYRQQRETKAERRGGFALNTYSWEWAPYIRYLKEKIQQHLYPPQAFTSLGIIHGDAVVRFRIGKDGQLIGVSIVDESGHQSLIDTSVNAIKSAAPYKPLPTDFPITEDFLEITAHFHYLNSRR